MQKVKISIVSFMLMVILTVIIDQHLHFDLFEKFVDIFQRSKQLNNSKINSIVEQTSEKYFVDDAEYYVNAFDSILKAWDNKKENKKIDKLETIITKVIRTKIDDQKGIIPLKERLELQQNIQKNIFSDENMRQLAGLPSIKFNQFFEILDHIHLPKNYVFDYIYYFDVMTGIPFIYARHFNSEAYNSIGSFPNWQKYLYNFHIEDTIDRPFLQFVELDQSALSYFQLALLALYCDHFFLFWHSGYRDETIVCSKNDLLKLLDLNAIQIEALLDSSFSSKFKNFGDNTSQIDLKPYVVLAKNVAYISFYYFTCWGGLYKVDWIVSRLYPHKEINFSKQKIINFESSVLY
jgi:hypothetical protein